jgi:hypothetical protein
MRMVTTLHPAGSVILYIRQDGDILGFSIMQTSDENVKNGKIRNNMWLSFRND